ncbi:hypothetical protein AVEN_143510-1 [Araneus ventricosus]|uniref:RNase H type-1 domain-containing protein n=1 Tax=Araneus ventricosus TaxID=182803 RepID=A0A4Y2TZX0_ARAVE|nr:hypothetical protein AVEN_143510-1 [Araneus ventricosus]
MGQSCTPNYHLRDGQFLNTKHYIRIFNNPKLPELIAVHPSEEEDELKRSWHVPATPTSALTSLEENCLMDVSSYWFGRLVWVKAHARIPGNELADQYAKIATTDGQELNIPAPYTYVKRKIKNYNLDSWQRHWEDSGKGVRVKGADFAAIKNRAEQQSLRFTGRSTLPYNDECRMFEIKTALSQEHDTSHDPD